MSIVVVVRNGIIYEERCAYESYKSDKGTTVKPKTQEELERWRAFSELNKQNDANDVILHTFNEVLKNAKALSADQEKELAKDLSDDSDGGEISFDDAMAFFDFCRNSSEVNNVDEYLNQIDKLVIETDDDGEKRRLLKIRQLLFSNMCRPYQARIVAKTLKKSGWNIDLSDYGDNFLNKGNIIGVSQGKDSAAICFLANGDVVIHSEIPDTDKRKNLQETVLKALQQGGATKAVSYCDKEQKSLKQVKKVQAKKKNTISNQQKNVVGDTKNLKKEKKQGAESNG